MSKKSNRLVKALLIATGTFFVGLGILGIFLPLLPTTPFLLLAAAIYSRSSERFYTWLLNNKVFGRYIKNYREGKGVPLRVQIFSIAFLWLTILVSIIMVSILWLKLILVLVAIGVTIHILRVQ